MDWEQRRKHIENVAKDGGAKAMIRASEQLKRAERRNVG